MGVGSERWKVKSEELWLPCKISSSLPIHAGRTLPVHPTACAPNPVQAWKCFWSFDEHTSSKDTISFSLRLGGFAWDLIGSDSSESVTEYLAPQPFLRLPKGQEQKAKSSFWIKMQDFFRAGRRIVRARPFGTFGLTKVHDKKKVTGHGWPVISWILP